MAVTFHPVASAAVPSQFSRDWSDPLFSWSCQAGPGPGKAMLSWLFAKRSDIDSELRSDSNDSERWQSVAVAPNLKRARARAPAPPGSRPKAKIEMKG